MNLVHPVSRVNGKLFVIQQVDQRLSYLIPVRYWNVFHLIGLLKHLLSPEPKVVTIEGLEHDDLSPQDGTNNDNLPGEFKTNS